MLKWTANKMFRAAYKDEIYELELKVRNTPYFATKGFADGKAIGRAEGYLVALSTLELIDILEMA